MMKYILVLFLMFSSVYADRDGGPYIGLGYGLANFDDGGKLEAENNTLLDNRVKASSLTLGAYMNKYFSVEFNYTDMTAWDTHKGYELEDKNSLKLFVVDVSTLAHYAFFDDLWDVYGKFGVGEVHQGNKEIKGFTFVYGVGTSVRLNEWLSLKLGFDRFSFGYDSNEDKSSNYKMKIDYLYTAIEFQF